MDSRFRIRDSEKRHLSEKEIAMSSRAHKVAPFVPRDDTPVPGFPIPVACLLIIAFSPEEREQIIEGVLQRNDAKHLSIFDDGTEGKIIRRK